jgi:riboflavin biosynthesis pyrimidine reductase
MKPHIICHMASSLDGRILPACWTPSDAHSHAAYEDLHVRLGGGSWIVGRVTGQEFAKGDTYPEQADGPIARTTWLPNTEADAYGIVIDAYGKIAWGRSDVGGDPIVVILTDQVSDAHLAGLRADGVGYIFAGQGQIDLRQALAILGEELGLDRLLLEGGGHLNGAFLRAGLVDEISLMLVPAIDGNAGAPAVFDGPEADTLAIPAVERLTLESHEVLDNGIVWLRYRVANAPSS